MTHNATDEELLQEIVDELKDAFEADLEMNVDNARYSEEFDVKYPSYMTKAKEKAAKFKQTFKGYRRICCLPSFSFGLVMASRVHSHYIHAPWFRLASLDSMIDVHGTVSHPILPSESTNMSDPIQRHRLTPIPSSSSPSSSSRASSFWNASPTRSSLPST